MQTGEEMSELRQDPTNYDRVIIATERAKRPHDFRKKELGAGMYINSAIPKETAAFMRDFKL